MASENIQTTSNLAVQPSTDLSYAFDDSQDLQVMAMTNQEMEETEGAWVPNAIGGIAGGLGGHFGYMSGSIASGKYSVGGHLAAIGAGAIGGAVSPVNGLNSAVTAFGVAGATAGATTYIGNKSSTVNIGR